jgi:hypothetical protein
MNPAWTSSPKRKESRKHTVRCLAAANFVQESKAGQEEGHWLYCNKCISTHTNSFLRKKGGKEATFFLLVKEATASAVEQPKKGSLLLLVHIEQLIHRHKQVSFFCRLLIVTIHNISAGSQQQQKVYCADCAVTITVVVIVQ